MDNWLRQTAGAPDARPPDTPPSDTPPSDTQAPDAPAPDQPFALVAEGAHGFVLAALNPAAREARLRPGQRLTDARTICPELIAEPADPRGDAATLTRLALWAQRWSPWTATDNADGLLVDVTGAAHLFGGEAALLRDMAQRLRAGGFAARIAVAPTIGAAWALARHARKALNIAHPPMLAARLAPLPVRSLRLDADAVLLLERLGLKTVGQLAAVPRLALARRFATDALGANPLLRLDQAMGRLDEPIAPVRREPPVRVVRRVTEPITHVAILEELLREMAGALCAELETRGLGFRRVRFDGFRVDGGVESVAAGTARAMRDPAHLHRLFDGKLETLDAGFGFDAVVLDAERHEPLDDAQVHLLEREGGDALLARLVDRLSARLGPDRVRRPAPVQSHIPERGVAWQPALKADGNTRSSRVKTRGAKTQPERPSFALGTNEIRGVPRPIRLLDRPEPVSVLYATPEGAPRRFVWRKLSHIVARSEGPERIAPEWWRERSTARLRDYYRVEDDAGRRYWLFREGLEGDNRGGPPAWFLHGLFA